MKSNLWTGDWSQTQLEQFHAAVRRFGPSHVRQIASRVQGKNIIQVASRLRYLEIASISSPALSDHVIEEAEECSSDKDVDQPSASASHKRRKTPSSSSADQSGARNDEESASASTVDDHDDDGDDGSESRSDDDEEQHSVDQSSADDGAAKHESSMVNQQSLSAKPVVRFHSLRRRLRRISTGLQQIRIQSSAESAEPSTSSSSTSASPAISAQLASLSSQPSNQPLHIRDMQSALISELGRWLRTFALPACFAQALARMGRRQQTRTSTSSTGNLKDGEAEFKMSSGAKPSTAIESGSKQGESDSSDDEPDEFDEPSSSASSSASAAGSDSEQIRIQIYQRDVLAAISASLPLSSRLHQPRQRGRPRKKISAGDVVSTKIKKRKQPEATSST